MYILKTIVEQEKERNFNYPTTSSESDKLQKFQNALRKKWKQLW